MTDPTLARDAGPAPANDGGPAFPTRWTSGMTLRDWLAGQAMAGMMANCDKTGMNGWLGVQEAVAEYAYKVADAMIAARSGGAA